MKQEALTSTRSVSGGSSLRAYWRGPAQIEFWYEKEDAIMVLEYVGTASVVYKQHKADWGAQSNKETSKPFCYIDQKWK